jgi:hypothetical protein
MNLRDRDPHRVSLHQVSWTSRPFSLCLAVVGDVFVLTSPVIERDYRNVAAGAGETAATRWQESRPASGTA